MNLSDEFTYLHILLYGFCFFGPSSSMVGLVG